MTSAILLYWISYCTLCSSTADHNQREIGYYHEIDYVVAIVVTILIHAALSIQPVPMDWAPTFAAVGIWRTRFGHDLSTILVLH